MKRLPTVLLFFQKSWFSMFYKLRIALVSALLALTVLTFGQQPGSPWPMFRQNNLNTAVGMGGGSNGIQKWAFQAGRYNTLGPAVIAVDGTIYFGADANLIALNSDGTQKWSFTTGSQIYGAPAIGSDGTIFVGSDDYKFYAVNPDGTKKWSYPTGSLVGTGPAFGPNGIVYVGSNDGYLYAFQSSGILAWKFPSYSGIASSPAVATDGTIYFGNDYGQFYAVNPDGTQKWTFATDANVGIVGAPAIGTDGTVYFGSYDHSLYAFTPDGTKKWSYQTGDLIWTSPAVAPDGTIYIGSDDKNLYALNPDGTLKWKFLATKKIEGSPVIGSDGTVYFGSFDFNIYAVKPDGTKLWSFTTGGFANNPPTIGGDGTLYVGSGDFIFYAIGTPITDVPILDFIVRPASVVGGSPSQGLVTLSHAAPSGGQVISIQSDHVEATVPSSFTIPAGSTTGFFAIPTVKVAANVDAVITATSGTSSKSATLTITPPIALISLSISPDSVLGGNGSTGTVTIKTAAPAEGVTINLSSSTASAIVPATVTIASGATSATFAVTTVGVSAPTTASISATLNGGTQSAVLSITPPKLTGFTLSRNATVGGNPVGGTITISGPAPASGLAVNLTSTNSNVVVSSPVMVPAGATSATVTVNSKVVSSTVTSTVTASFGSNSFDAKLAVQPPGLDGVSLSASGVVGGSTTNIVGTVYLSGPAPISGLVITLKSSSASLVKVPISAKISGGTTSATFTVSHKMVSSLVTYTITAGLGTLTKTTTLTLSPFVLNLLTLSPTTVNGGDKSTGTVTLNAAPSTFNGAVLVKLSSSAPYATVAASVAVPVGSTTGIFSVLTKAVSSGKTVGILGKLGTSAQQTQLTIQQPYLASVTLSPTTVKGIASTVITGTVLLTGIAPTGGLSITLNSSNPSAAKVPVSVVVPVGKITGTFKVTHSKVTSQSSVTITASSIGISKTATLTVTP